MRALVVYETSFGNTEKVARMIGHVLSSDMVVEVHEVGELPVCLPDDRDLVVIGAPATSDSSAIREWLEQLPTGSRCAHVAVFDTRLARLRHLPGSAARKVDRLAQRAGLPPAIDRESFFVAHPEGPLLPGEVERACRWAQALCRHVRDGSRRQASPRL